MKIKRQQVIIAALIVLGLTFLTIGVFLRKEPTRFFAHSLRTWQEADSVAGYPIATAYDEDGVPVDFKTTAFQPNLSTMSAMERFRLPTARGFLKHDGSDARAAGTGLVLFAGDPMGYQGKAVLLGHRLPNGDLVQTFYSGLSTIEVRVGDHVPRSTRLGEGGKLLEVRTGSSIDIALETIEGITLNSENHPPAPNRIPLDEFFANHKTDTNVPDPLRIIQEAKLNQAREELGIGIE